MHQYKERTSFFSHKTYAWLVIGMLWVIACLNYADRQVVSSILPVLEKEFSFTKLQLGLIGSAFMWGYAGLALLAGFCVDRWPRKYLILGGCLFWSIITMLTGRCSALWQFVSVRALEGVGESFYFPASNSLLADYHGTRTRSLAMSLHMSGLTVGAIIGGSLGAWFAQYYGWRYGFYFFGGLGVILSLAFIFFLKEPERGCMEVVRSASLNEALAPKAFLRYLVKKPVFGLLIATFAGTTCVNGIFMVWMPLFLYDKFHCSLTMAGFSGVMLMQTAAVLTTPWTGCLSDRLALKASHNRLAIQGICLLLGAVVIVAIGQLTTFAALMVALVLFGMCKGGYDSGGLAAIFDQIEPRARGSALGVSVTVGALGGGLGPLAIGALSGQGIQGMSRAISWSAAIYLLGGLVTLVVFLSLKKKYASKA